MPIVTLFGSSIYGKRHLMFYQGALRRQLMEQGWTIIAEFSCRVYDTYGIGKLLGGIAK
jgi:hypothetical protein